MLSKGKESAIRASFLPLHRSDLGILSGISECIFFKHILCYIRIRFSNSTCHGLCRIAVDLLHQHLLCPIYMTNYMLGSEQQPWNGILKKKFARVDNFVNCYPMNTSKDWNCFLHLHTHPAISTCLTSIMSGAWGFIMFWGE